ncbi:uncharacterized protein A4U43_C05F35000 [Asparagus officinalis]|uniref:Uncharacterized protein n=1 Tax=Asparagus officinalis TaxID=4686 RepID=A0A5P1EYM8_ASPOF|nr:uncharacterized protein A4U43_C05F35000 [Asparagus officinalis]
MSPYIMSLFSPFSRMLTVRKPLLHFHLNRLKMGPAMLKLDFLPHDRRYKDRSRLLGPNGVIVKENGVLGHCDLKRSVQKHKDTCEDTLDKRPRMGCSLGIEIVEDGEEVVEQCSAFELCSRRNPIQVPIGIQRPLTLASSRDSINTSLSTGELCHSEDLMKRMEGIVRARGLEGVPVDCANLLNNGLDTYLKQLIRSCFQLVVSRSEQESIKNPIFQQPNKKAVNGVWQGNNMHILSSDGFLNRRIEHISHGTVSLQDFRVAMEMNPVQLGENWPLLLEKICLRSFEE